MHEAPRASHGIAGPLVLLVVGLVVFWGVNTLSSAPAGSLDASPTRSASPSVVTEAAPSIGPRPLPHRPVSVRLPPWVAGGASPFCAHGRCCRTSVTTFGTRTPIARVIAFFQGRRFHYAAPPLTMSGSGDPHTSGGYLRWLGERGTSPQSWRQANVARGSIVKRPGWATVFTVSRAHCSPPFAPHTTPAEPRH
jgi:hypothetical protein